MKIYFLYKLTFEGEHFVSECAPDLTDIMIVDTNAENSPSSGLVRRKVSIANVDPNTEDSPSPAPTDHQHTHCLLYTSRCV